MNPNANRLFQEIVSLLEQLRQETQESQSYYQRNDKNSAARNLNGAKDELNALVQKYNSLISEVNKS
ncbi:MAG: hypothetical protein V4702_06075 [Patescibacteria group bacterium]